MSSDPPVATVNRIGRYEVIGELGRGGMGVVYRGEDKLIGRDVAIKTLTEVTPELRERFYVEARSGILSHPNIVTVYEVGESDGVPFIAMEFLAGESLDKILRERGRLPVLETLSIVEQLCAGLGYAHQHGLLHRDVKPANVMVLPDGRAKIVDFGIARLADQNTRLTKTDAVLGTFHYIAPERLKGAPSDGRADIWSVGVMLYEMMSGELPFKGRDVSTLYRVIHEPYVPLAQRVQNLPEAFNAVLDKALAKDVGARYSTPEEMAFDLQAIGEGLKRERVHELLETARRLSEERQFAGARTVLLQVQRTDPANAAAKVLMQEVQEHLNNLQRGEQIRQILDQAEDALASNQYEDAITYYTQAKGLDTEGAFALTGRLNQAQALKDQFQRVRSLSDQASEARSRGDLTAAQNLLEQALQLDQKNTALRSALSIVLREIKRKQDGVRVEDLLKSAREEYSTRRYTDVIARLREAAEIDPMHSEVQQLLMMAAARQKEERRRQVLDRIVVEIQDCIDGEDLDRAHDRVNRALETLPAETLLLRLKSEIEQKKRKFDAQQIVRSAILQAQNQLLEHPVRGLGIIDAALEQVPGDEGLLQFRSNLQEHLGRLQKEESRAELLKRVHEMMEAGRFEDAIRELESGITEGGPSEELESLLALAQRERQLAAERRERDALWLEIQQLQATRAWDRIVARLEPAIGSGKDASLVAVLEDAKRQVLETAERVETLLSRARTLAESDVAGALRLVSVQPQEVLANNDVKELRETLVRRVELARAIDTATAKCEERLAAGDLSGSLDSFARLAKAHGQSAELATAKEGCEQKRQSVADTALKASMTAARSALLDGGAKRAQQELQKTRQIVQFASVNVQGEWQGAREQAKSAARRKYRDPGQTVSVKKWTKAGTYIALLLVVTLCVGVGVRHIRRGSTAPAPVRSEQVQTAPVGTYLEVNASPWATVVKIEDNAGKSLDLPGSDRTTPLRLDGVSVGKYTVTLKGSDDQVQTTRCDISVEQHLCAVDLGQPDIQQVLAGGRP